jgi:oxygen-dependent protoporphyrinogen oxidase
MSATRHVVVVGGGIAGLAAARSLLAGSAPGRVRVTVLEADGRLGGKVWTQQFSGRPLDVGAEALLARVPAAPALSRELGLGDELVAPSTDQAYVWTDSLHPLPPRLLAGSPGGARDVIATRVLSPWGFARTTLDVALPSRAITQDISIGALVRRRLGNEMLERLIDPLMGGIHAGNCDELSTLACAPQLSMAMAKHRGLVRGLRSMVAGAPAAGPTFLTLRRGLGSLVDALGDSLGEASLRLGAALERIESSAGATLELTLHDGQSLAADHVILAVPAHAASEILAAACPGAAIALQAIPYASVATVALSFAAGEFPQLPHGSGFLVQRGSKHLMTACTFSSAKWEHMGGDGVILKCSVGRSDDRRLAALHDDEVLDRVREDLRVMLGVGSVPRQAQVFRFDRALPQYLVGHHEKVRRIETELQALPGVSLCGAAYRGVGVGACIRDGQTTAAAVLRELGEATVPDAPSQPILT